MNVVKLIEEQAQKTPHKKAVIFPEKNKTSFYTFEKLMANCNSLSHNFEKKKITKGTKVLLFVKPSLNFSVITFSLFKLGAVPIFIDPGIGLSNLLRAIDKTKPQVFITETKGLILKALFSKWFKSVKQTFCTRDFLTLQSIESILRTKTTPTKKHKVKLTEADTASILFTSGGTGKPKGVIYTHGMFLEQIKLLKKEFQYTGDDRDLPGFPLFSLMTMAMGVTSVIPELDPRKPSLCNPQKIVKNILDHEVTTMAGSPAIWEKVGLYCIKHSIKLKTVRALIMFGAPVPKRLHKIFKKILPNGTSYTPYGATECLPVSNISAHSLEKTKLPKNFKHRAICVGKAIAQTKIKIIKEHSSKDLKISQTKELAPYDIGEIIIQGAQASPSYFEEEEETRLSKIKDKGLFWHKMGDLGFLDHEKRLWFCGRSKHKIKTSQKEYYSIPTELVFNGHKEIKKTALIGLHINDKITPALVVERYDRKTRFSPNKKKLFKEELLKLAKSHTETDKITQFFVHKSLPVDRRHNIKIDRNLLSHYFSHRPQKVL